MKTEYCVSIKATSEKCLGKNLHILNKKKIYQYIDEYIHIPLRMIAIGMTQYSYDMC